MTSDPVASFREWLERGIAEFERQREAEWEALPDVLEHDGVLFSKDLLR